MKRIGSSSLIGLFLMGGLVGCEARVYAPRPAVYVEPAPVYAPPPAAVVTVGPPAPLVEVIPPAPGPGFVWVGGFHRWDGRGYVWVGGHYDRVPYGHHRWIAHHWEQGPHGWVLIEGRWD